MGATGIIGKDSLMTAVGNFDLSKETLNLVVNRNIKRMHKNDRLYILHALKRMGKSRTFKLVKTDTNVSSNMP